METMAFYLFSSLLQADAAIIGLSAIFVIYKLQSLETQFQNAYAILSNAQPRPGFDYSGFADDLLLAQDIRMQVGIFSTYNAQIAYRKQFELIIMIPELTKEIRTLVRLPLFLMGIHMASCAFLLWITPALKDSQLIVFGAGIVGSFILILMLIGNRALKIVEGEPTYKDFLTLLLKQKRITQAHIDG